MPNILIKIKNKGDNKAKYHSKRKVRFEIKDQQNYGSNKNKQCWSLRVGGYDSFLHPFIDQMSILTPKV